MSPSAMILGATYKAARCACMAIAVLLVTSAGRAWAFPSPWCIASPAPCVESATIDGMPFGPGNMSNVFQLVPFTDGAAREFIFQVENSMGGDDLGAGGLGEVWSVVINTGTLVPRVASAQAANVTFLRSPQPGGTYLLTITASPTTITDNNECNFSGPIPTCPFKAMNAYTAYLATQISDYNYPAEYTPAQINAFYGMDMSTNIAETGLPPQIVPDPQTGTNEVILQLANQHELPNSSLFLGFMHLRIPDGFLQQFYGINDPSTITDNALSASIGAGTVTLQEQPGGGALLLDLTGVTFTHRTLTIRRGVVTPTRPLHLHARRTGAHAGKISFQPSRPRGLRITGYRVVCHAVGGVGQVTASGRNSPIRITGLAADVAYRCTVRARAKAKLGQPSAAVHLPA